MIRQLYHQIVHLENENSANNDLRIMQIDRTIIIDGDTEILLNIYQKKVQQILIKLWGLCNLSSVAITFFKT